MKEYLLTTAILTTFFVYQPAFAYESHDKPATEVIVVLKATTAPEALAEIQAGIKSVGEMVNDGKLDGVHVEIEKIEAASKVIKEKAAVDGNKKTRLEAAIKQFNTQIGKVHIAADGKDAKKTKVEFKKAEGALKLVESALK